MLLHLQALLPFSLNGLRLQPSLLLLSGQTEWLFFALRPVVDLGDVAASVLPCLGL